MKLSTTSEKITLTYPLYCADFLDVDHLVVGGGGGEGRSGVGNKIVRFFPLNSLIPSSSNLPYPLDSPRRLKIFINTIPIHNANPTARSARPSP
jgi:hypothetical protein